MNFKFPDLIWICAVIVFFFSSLPTWAQITVEQHEVKPEATEIWVPEPVKIDPGDAKTPPSDAIILFNGKDLSAWKSKQGGEAKWNIADGAFTVVPGAGDIMTKEEFKDFQLHIEWRSPQQIKGDGQGRGNSGIFLQGLYELQVLDSYNNKTYSNGQAGSIYKQAMPLVNATRPPDQWEVYDIIYTAPTFYFNGALDKPGKVTVLHNGIVIQYDTKIYGTTEYIGTPKTVPLAKGPILLQDHGNPVSFRNVWIRNL